MGSLHARRIRAAPAVRRVLAPRTRRPGARQLARHVSSPARCGDSNRRSRSRSGSLRRRRLHNYSGGRDRACSGQCRPGDPRVGCHVHVAAGDARPLGAGCARCDSCIVARAVRGHRPHVRRRRADARTTRSSRDWRVTPRIAARSARPNRRYAIAARRHARGSSRCAIAGDGLERRGVTRRGLARRGLACRGLTVDSFSARLAGGVHIAAPGDPAVVAHALRRTAGAVLAPRPALLGRAPSSHGGRHRRRTARTTIARPHSGATR